MPGPISPMAGGVGNSSAHRTASAFCTPGDSFSYLPTSSSHSYAQHNSGQGIGQGAAPSPPRSEDEKWLVRSRVVLWKTSRSTKTYTRFPLCYGNCLGFCPAHRRWPLASFLARRRRCPDRHPDRHERRGQSSTSRPQHLADSSGR